MVTGEILLEGVEIDRLHPEDVARKGVSHVPQGRRILPGLTVHENLIEKWSTWEPRH